MPAGAASPEYEPGSVRLPPSDRERLRVTRRAGAADGSDAKKQAEYLKDTVDLLRRLVREPKINVIVSMSPSCAAEFLTRLRTRDLSRPRATYHGGAPHHGRPPVADIQPDRHAAVKPLPTFPHLRRHTRRHRRGHRLPRRPPRRAGPGGPAGATPFHLNSPPAAGGRGHARARIGRFLDVLDAASAPPAINVLDLAAAARRKRRSH